MITLPVPTTVTPFAIAAGVGLVVAFGCIYLSIVARGLAITLAILSLLTAIVFGPIALQAAANNSYFASEATLKQVKQQYGLTLTQDQAERLDQHRTVKLDDGTQVKLKFTDRRHAQLVRIQVQYKNF